MALNQNSLLTIRHNSGFCFVVVYESGLLLLIIIFILLVFSVFISYFYRYHWLFLFSLILATNRLLIVIFYY